MRRDPAFTFRGALQILGQDDNRWLSRLNDLLGGAVLASGALTAGVSALWGWVDQKNEAVALVRQAVGAVSDRFDRTGGLARHELVVAAHTTLVVSAFFDTLREVLPTHHSRADLSDAEKAMLASGTWHNETDEFIRFVYGMEVPAPSAVRGFQENVLRVEKWANDRAVYVFRFLAGCDLHAGAQAVLDPRFGNHVSKRYSDNFLRMTKTVHEFKVWSDLVEHAATRSAFARLETLLTAPARQRAPRDLRAIMAKFNKVELDRPVIDVNIDGYGFEAAFPTVADIFVTPRFRLMEKTRDVSLADEHRWSTTAKPQRNLDLVLARHFSSADATRRPLLLLGHPGAGKSLVTKVLAARLPTSTYTVVRVPLRRVDANANVSEQIQQALTLTTHGRVQWAELADQSADVIRVILLDGLDELLQASTHDRSGYLTDIAEFQRTEHALGQPVAVVVTSRTVVVDRVPVPLGTPVIKLEEFADDQVLQWISVWNATNPALRPMTREIALGQGDLARQPLLLLMLALYFADPDSVMPESGLSQNELYERLLDTYARREVTKTAGQRLSVRDLGIAVREQLVRLSIAAIGMFNRGSQSITEAELGADLAALGVSTPAGRLLGEFFFIHSAEATSGSIHRSYEFLHATFGEYLVASWVVDVLCDVAEGSYGRRHFHDPNDELLFSLLSHQPMSLRWRVLEFVTDNMCARDARELDDVVRTLDLLITTHRERRGGHRYLEYRPLPPDTVRALATYTANLVLLRVCVPTVPLRLVSLWPAEEADNAWRDLASLWTAGLDTEGHRTMVSSLDLSNGVVVASTHDNNSESLFLEYRSARLRGDRRTATRLRLAHAVHDHAYLPFDRDPDAWETTCRGWLLSLTGLEAHWPGSTRALAPPDGVPAATLDSIVRLANAVLGVHCVHWARGFTKSYLKWLMRFPVDTPVDPLVLEMVKSHVPDLFMEMSLLAGTAWRSLAGADGQTTREDVGAARVYLRRVLGGSVPDR